MKKKTDNSIVTRLLHLHNACSRMKEKRKRTRNLNEHLIESVLGSAAMGENSGLPVITEGEEQGKLGSIYLKAVSHQHDFTLKSTSANFVPK